MVLNCPATLNVLFHFVFLVCDSKLILKMLFMYLCLPHTLFLPPCPGRLTVSDQLLKAYHNFFAVAESWGENMKREQIKGLLALGLCRGLMVAGV